MSLSTIAAVITPPGTGAVAVVRISGPASEAVAQRVFAGRGRGAWTPRRQHYGRIVDAAGEGIDEGLLTFFPGPGSFTGEDVVEIACHGGVVVTGRVLRAVLAAGAEPAGPGEFTQRAFLNGRMDLTEAEAVMDLISAQTELAAKAAGMQLEGALGRRIEAIRKDLVALVAHVEAHIDFPEEDIAPDSEVAMLGSLRSILEGVDGLLATADQGRILREGIRTVICGAPNAGKSSLLNRLLGFDRAIVSASAGTTRDTLEEVVNLEGIPLRLVDTAGIRDEGNAVEREGIARTHAQLAAAELVLFVVDASAPAVLLPSIEIPEGTNHVRILNKSDLPRHRDWEGQEGVALSCLDEGSVANLRRHLYQRITAGTGIASANLVSINERHRGCLRRARGDLESAEAALRRGESPEFVAVDLRGALEAIGEVVGRTDVEEILGEIFGRFCIGK